VSATPRPAHPGTIVFFIDDRPPRIRPAAEVPPHIAFVDGRVPVLRVDSCLVGKRRVVRSYGARDELLLTTWQG
jgi:hypothetical protein